MKKILITPIDFFDIRNAGMCFKVEFAKTQIITLYLERTCTNPCISEKKHIKVKFYFVYSTDQLKQFRFVLQRESSQRLIQKPLVQHISPQSIESDMYLTFAFSRFDFPHGPQQL